MKPTREQCLEWARDCDIKAGQHWNKNHMDTKHMINLILRAYAEGQDDMRDKVARRLEACDGPLAHLIALEIRNLEIGL